jgi:hypothetical protein
MPGIKTDDHVSERLLSIDWGKPDSNRQPEIPAQDPPPRDLKGRCVCVRIDEVFHHISAYRALIDAEVEAEGLLARSLIAQANAVFNQAFVNLEKRHGFSKVFVDAPVGARNIDDITGLVIQEVHALQRMLDT